MVFLQWPKRQRHHENHYSQRVVSRINQCCKRSGISKSSNGAGRWAGTEQKIYVQNLFLPVNVCLFLWRESEPVDINSQWRESWKSASVVNAHLVDNPTIRQPGFALPRQQWSLLNCFRTGQGHCGACKKKWKLSDSDQCSCGETQTMSHIAKSCPQTRLHNGLSKLHSADNDAVAWLTSYGS